MQIGMSLTTSYGIERDPKALMDGLTEQVKAMTELGFASLSLGDHHVTRNNYFQVLPTMSHLSAYTGDMRLIPLFLLPFYNPILLAEQLAMLDVISGGRTTVISGLGHQPEAHDAFETPQRLRVSRFTETFEIMRLLWEKDEAFRTVRKTLQLQRSVGQPQAAQPASADVDWRERGSGSSTCSADCGCLGHQPGMDAGLHRGAAAILPRRTGRVRAQQRGERACSAPRLAPCTVARRGAAGCRGPI